VTVIASEITTLRNYYKCVYLYFILFCSGYARQIMLATRQLLGPRKYSSSYRIVYVCVSVPIDLLCVMFVAFKHFCARVSINICICIVPGHSVVGGHVDVSTVSPSHGRPSYRGSGLSQRRSRRRSPSSPHVVEHSDHGPHADQPPSTDTHASQPISSATLQRRRRAVLNAAVRRTTYTSIYE